MVWSIKIQKIYKSLRLKNSLLCHVPDTNNQATCYGATNAVQIPHTDQPYQLTSDMHNLKVLKNLFGKLPTILNLLTTVLAKFE
jgi:hypothetical protein